jgi:branched-chain amino acid transport system permease protein
LVGAFAFALIQEFFKSETIFGDFSKHWHLGLGLTIMLSVIWLPNGLAGLPEQIKNRLMGNPMADKPDDTEQSHAAS